MGRIITAAQHFCDHHGARYDRATHLVFGRLHARARDDAIRAAPPGGTVLDVGAGPGRVAVALAARRPDLTVHAVDISPDMVSVARQRAAQEAVTDRTHIVAGDVAHLPLPDESIDLIVSTVSFHHWQDVLGAARELRRVVRSTGRIWIYDARIAPWRRLSAAVGAPIQRTPAGILFVRADVPH